MMAEDSVRLVQALDNWTTQETGPSSQDLTPGWIQPEFIQPELDNKLYTGQVRGKKYVRGVICMNITYRVGDYLVRLPRLNMRI